MPLTSKEHGMFRAVLKLQGCHGPSASWPTFARRERKRKSAIPVGMTEGRKNGPPGSVGPEGARKMPRFPFRKTRLVTSLNFFGG